MLTFEKVLEIFADYLKEDPYAEVVRTRHCYAPTYWRRNRTLMTSLPKSRPK